MDKLALACMGDVLSPKLWSGTCRKMWDQFVEKGNYEMVPFDSGYYPSTTKKKLMTIYSKFFWLEAHNIFNEREWNEQLSQRLKGMNVNSLLYLAEYLYDESFSHDIKYYAYIDSEKVYWSRYMLKRYMPFYHIQRYFYKKYIKKALSGQQLVFTQNEWSREALIKTYDLPEEKVKNVHFGVNCSFLEEQKDYTKDLLLIILRKGGEKYKGLKLLIKALPIIRKSLPNVRLAVVGTDYGQDIEGVDCYYNQPREKTLELLRECTLYTMPSLSEPNGVTYLEALANKAPIVGLDRFAFPEFAGRNEERGFIVSKANYEELAATIIRAIKDKDKLEKMGERGIDFVKSNFDWSVVVDKISNYINNEAK